MRGRREISFSSASQLDKDYSLDYYQSAKAGRKYLFSKGIHSIKFELENKDPPGSWSDLLADSFGKWKPL